MLLYLVCNRLHWSWFCLPFMEFKMAVHCQLCCCFAWGCGAGWCACEMISCSLGGPCCNGCLATIFLLRPTDRPHTQNNLTRYAPGHFIFALTYFCLPFFLYIKSHMSLCLLLTRFLSLSFHPIFIPHSCLLSQPILSFFSHPSGPRCPHTLTLSVSCVCVCV